jgi:hypothetical protein
MPSENSGNPESELEKIGTIIARSLATAYNLRTQ